jgi:hypothetical protein
MKAVDQRDRGWHDKRAAPGVALSVRLGQCVRRSSKNPTTAGPAPASRCAWRTQGCRPLRRSPTSRHSPARQSALQLVFSTKKGAVCNVIFNRLIDRRRSSILASSPRPARRHPIVPFRHQASPAGHESAHGRPTSLRLDPLIDARRAEVVRAGQTHYRTFADLRTSWAGSCAHLRQDVGVLRQRGRRALGLGVGSACPSEGAGRAPDHAPPPAVVEMMETRSWDPTRSREHSHQRRKFGRGEMIFAPVTCAARTLTIANAIAVAHVRVYRGRASAHADTVAKVAETLASNDQRVVSSRRSGWGS